jgi:hypothetical protein
MRLVENFNSNNLYSRPECHVVSKAFLISKNTAAVDILFFKFRGTWSARLIHLNIVLWSARKPQWPAYNKFLSSVCCWIVLKISFSNSLPAVDKRLIWRKFWRNMGSLLGLGRVMILASIQGAGTWPSRRQWLNKCIKCTKGLLGRWRRHSFGMPSKSHAFPNFKYCIFWDVTRSELNRGVFIDDSQLASTWASICRRWSQSHKSCVMSWLSKQSTIMLALSFGSNMGSKGPWIADGTFGPPLLVRDFTIGHIACSATS